MDIVHNLETIADEYVDDTEFSTRMKTLYLGAAAGSQRLYVNIDHLKPGAKSAKYHSHSMQEEFFLILEGKGMLRIDGKQFEVGKGDFIAKPAGEGIAHQFTNTGEEIMQILDCGIPDPDDVIKYPDDDVVYIKSLKKAFRQSEALNGWSSDPD